ncbi:MAG: hypothetical protein R2750_06725 [Bacteroidales bacterium]
MKNKSQIKQDEPDELNELDQFIETRKKQNKTLKKIIEFENNRLDKSQKSGNERVK